MFELAEGTAEAFKENVLVKLNMRGRVRFN